jgi:hypothetical protein
VQDSHIPALCDFDTYIKIGHKYKVPEEQMFNIDPAGVPVIQTHKKALAKKSEARLLA